MFGYVKQFFFIKIDKLWGTIFVVILFYQKIFPSYSFTLIVIWKMMIKIFSWFQRSIEGYRWLVPKWTHWLTKIVCVDDKDVFFVYKVNQMLRVTYSRMNLLKDEKHVCSSCHAPKPAPRAWRSFHTLSPKAQKLKAETIQTFIL